MNVSYFSQISLDLVKVILAPFQLTEDSLFVSLVCKQCNYSLFNTFRIVASKIDCQVTFLRFRTNSGSNDSRFFSETVFAHNPEVALWAYQEFLKLQNEKLYGSVVSGLSRGGHLDILKSVASLPWFPPFSVVVCRYAAYGGHIPILEWARTNCFRRDKLASFYAAEAGQIEALKWLRANGYIWDVYTCAYAAKGGQLETLKWLRANNCPWDKSTCHYAAREGNLEIIKWARANQCDWSDTTRFAAESGNLEILKWLHYNGCPWDNYTATTAAIKGHLEVLIWARMNGCPWNSSTCAEAAYTGQLETLKWAREHGCTWPSELDVTRVAGLGHLHILKYLYEEGVSMEYLFTFRYPFDNNIADWIATIK